MHSDCVFAGPHLTPGFVSRALPALLSRNGLYLSDPAIAWPAVRRGLRDFAGTGGPIRVLHHVLTPIARGFGYRDIRREDAVATREGPEDGGHTLLHPEGATLRAWSFGSGIDLESPSKRGAGARVSPSRQAARVLRARGECAGLVTNGTAIRLLLCDPAGRDSHITIAPAPREDVPEWFRLVGALASPAGVASMEEIFDAARLHQTSVTKTLRTQARAAIESFLQCVLDRQADATVTPEPDVLWREALTIVYRLLFILKLESAPDPGRGFSFAASAAWRKSLSPNRALGPLARRHLDLGHDTGHVLEAGLRVLFQVCRDGLSHSGLSIAPLGFGLFDPARTAVLDGLRWGERAVALLLDRLLWTIPGGKERERVHYGSLDVEELGRVYESLLDLEPDVARVAMVRCRRGRLEVVVPAATADAAAVGPAEPIPAGRFFARSGLGRRAGGSYYTPHDFVAYLVRETLTPLTAPLIARADPESVLLIKVFDPAMGSGHFLVEACRFLADGLYEACRRCDASGTAESRRRIDALPDPDHRLASYLPSRSHDRSDAGPSRTRALAICRRLIATHCLYGADQDPLAVELAKLSLWLESFAEGLPLTFLDHRLIAGDSVGGPFFADLARLPIGGGELDPLLARGVMTRLAGMAGEAMEAVRQLNASIGTSIADVMVKQAAKDRLDRLLSPLRTLARAWSGAIRSNAREANDAWLALARAIADTGVLPDDPSAHQATLLAGSGTALPLDLMFPEVFRPDRGNGGFHAVLGNPPWDVIHYQTREYLAAVDPAVMDAPTRRERDAIERKLLRDPAISDGFARYKNAFVERKRLCDRMFPRTGPSGSIDMFQIFTERMLNCVTSGGAIGLVVPSSFHANEGTMHLRRRLLDDTALESCFTFENRKKLFDIHGRQKFTLIVARRTGVTSSFRCGFYLNSIAQLNDPDRIMVYDRDFVAATGGTFGTFLELHGAVDLRIARHMFAGHPDMRTWMAARNIVFGREAHMTDDSHRFTPVAQAAGGDSLPLHEGKTFHQFTDRWKTRPRYAIGFDAMRDKPGWQHAAAHYRLAFREISRSTDERTMIAAIIPPGHIFGHKATCEKTPWQRPDAAALVLCAVFNAFPFDWCIRRKAAASISLFMLHGCPAPALSDEAARFLAHGTLRLSCDHAGYHALWRTQLAGRRAPAAPADRAVLRAAMDAVVAQAYGLGRDDYQHILRGFSHKTFPAGPDQCLSAFDLLTQLGTKSFFHRFDPFADRPLIEEASRPRPLPHSVMALATASAALIPSTPAERIPPA